MDYLDFSPVKPLKIELFCNLSFLELDEGRPINAAIRGNFDYVELDQGRSFPLPAYDMKLCSNCGYPNPRGNDYCQMCQLELFLFRNLELDTGPVKVKVSFPKSQNLILCDICGAFNEKGQYFCKDCATPLM